MGKTYRLIIFLILVGLTSMSGCQRKTTSVLFDQSTPLPGWRGIIPGKTSMVDVINIINNMPDLDIQSGCTEKFDYHGYESIRCYLNNKVDFTLGFDNNIVQVIIIGPSTVSNWYYFFNPNSTSLETAIEKLGEPELLISSGRSFPAWFDQYIINPEMGFTISYITNYSRNNRWPYEINPKGKIWLLFYFNPEIFDELIDRGIFHAGITSTPEETRERIQPWRGYGVISELYPTE